MSELNKAVSTLTFGETDGVPWLEQSTGGPRLHGFWTDADDAELYDDLRPDLPRTLPRRYFRLSRDYLTRHRYPHMRPDLKPGGFAADEMMGFHGQHKDTIADISTPSVRAILSDAFRPKSGQVIIDCGAFLGFSDIRIALEMESSTIYAIEASPRCYALLELNVRYNGTGNVVPIHQGVWNEVSTLDLQTSYAQANSLITEAHKGETTVSVPTITIDGLVDIHVIQRVDMISITLNGAEPEALEGAEKTLSACHPRIRLSGWDERGGKPIFGTCREILECHNFQVYVGARGHTLAMAA